MELTFAVKFVLVMLSMILADIAWTYYFIKVEERKSMSAGIWGSLILCFGAFTTINYIHDTRLFIAAVLGSFLGTFGAVEFKKRKENKKKNENDNTRGTE
jgi:hypothetical protein